MNALTDYINQRKAERTTQQPVRSYYHFQQQRKISKSQLEPVSFYHQFGIHIKTGGSVWQMVKCPFHDDTHASMGVNRVHGGYKCHACDVSGDMIKFYMTYKGVDFITACKELQLKGDNR